jgi:hypothetical protein
MSKTFLQQAQLLNSTMNERKPKVQKKLLQPLLSESTIGVKRKADTSLSDTDSDYGDDLNSLEECCIDAIIDFLSTDGLPKLKEIIKEAQEEYCKNKDYSDF